LYTQRNGSRLSVEEFAKITHSQPVHMEWLVNGQFECREIWQDGKFIETRIDLPRPNKPRNVSDAHTQAFNGEEVYMHDLSTPQDGEPPEEFVTARLLENMNADPARPDTAWGNGHILHVAGYRVPGRISDMRARMPMRSEIRALLDEGGRLVSVEEVELNGQRLTRLRIVVEDAEYWRVQALDLDEYAERLRRASAESEERQRERIEQMRKKKEQPKPDDHTHTFWLDAKLNYAVRQREWHEGARLQSRAVCDDFAKPAGRDLQLPRKVTLEWFDDGLGPDSVVYNEALLRHVMEVTQISFERVPDSTFVPKITTANCTFVDYREQPDRPIETTIGEDGIPPRR
jgi:hypothetical protein